MSVKSFSSQINSNTCKTPGNLNFEIVLEKTENGFGIVIESSSQGVLVKDRSPTITVLSIIPESIGQIQVGDKLLKIDDQDVHNWTISSILEFIGENRFPIHSSARFSFGRKNHCMAIRPLAIRSVYDRLYGSPNSWSPRSSGRQDSFGSSPNTTPREVVW